MLNLDAFSPERPEYGGSGRLQDLKEGARDNKEVYVRWKLT